MSPLTLTTILLFLSSIRRSLGGFDTKNSTMSSLVQRDSRRVNFGEEELGKLEKGMRGNSSIYDRGESNRKKLELKSYEKEHDNGRRNSGDSESLDQGRNWFEEHDGCYRKKGHRRTGFTNNYHKDVSGNNSSFYDDSDHRWGHRSSENTGEYYGEKSQGSYSDDERDASYAKGDGPRKASQDNREIFDGYRGHSGERSDNRYSYDDYLQDQAASLYARNGKEFYHQRVYPTFYRNGEYYMPSFGYSRNYPENLLRRYYREEPFLSFSGDYRYSLNRDDDFERDIYYPGGGFYDFYDNEYNNNNDNNNNKYRRGFDDGYYGF